MKYRVKDNSLGDTISLMFLWWLSIPNGYKDEPFSIEYKKHWWNKWKDYTENYIIKRFKTKEEAHNYIIWNLR